MKLSLLKISMQRALYFDRRVQPALCDASFSKEEASCVRVVNGGSGWGCLDECTGYTQQAPSDETRNEPVTLTVGFHEARRRHFYWFILFSFFFT